MRLGKIMGLVMDGCVGSDHHPDSNYVGVSSIGSLVVLPGGCKCLPHLSEISALILAISLQWAPETLR